MLDQLQSGQDTEETRRAMIQYYTAMEDEYEWRWRLAEDYWDRELMFPLEARFDYFISSWMRATVIHSRGRFARNSARERGEASPQTRPMLEQAVWVYDTFPARIKGLQAKAFDAFITLAGDIMHHWFDPSVAQTPDATQRELRTAFWAIHKAAEAIRPVDEHYWRLCQPWLTADVDILLILINDFGDDALKQETAGLREVMNERRAILSGEVGVKRGEGTAVYVADQIHLRHVSQVTDYEPTLVG
jgi:hypothetical protein